MDFFTKLAKDTNRLMLYFFEILFYLFIFLIFIACYSLLKNKTTNKSPKIFYNDKAETPKKEIDKREIYKIVDNN